VLQHAFAGGAFAPGAVSDTERPGRSRLSGAGDIVFDWDVPGDRVFVSPEVEQQRACARARSAGPPRTGWS
jgi:hypothetical protein